MINTWPIFTFVTMLIFSSNLTAKNLIEDLVFLEDFEQDNFAYFMKRELIETALIPSHYQDGRFGRGYFFEKPQHNFFSKKIANPEKDIHDFIQSDNTELSLVKTDSDFGSNALKVYMGEKGAGFSVEQSEIVFKRQRVHETVVTLLASCYLKGPKGEKVTLSLQLRPVKKKVKKVLLQKLNIPKPTQWIKDESFPQTIVLTGDWQRTAAYVSADSRVNNRVAIFNVISEASPSIQVLVDGLQLEQVRYYPFHHLMPTTWVAGGKERPNTTSTIRNRHFNNTFPIKAGTIAFWTKTPFSSNLKEPGSINWLNFGIWWHNPVWGMGNYRLYAGSKDFCSFSQTKKVADGEWHHVVMTWDNLQGKVYLDGMEIAKFTKNNVDIREKLEQYKFRLGGSVQSIGTASSVMDEIAIFNRPLSAREVSQLANAKTPLADKYRKKLLLSPPSRTIFFRDEGVASLSFILFLREKYQSSKEISSKGFTHIIEFAIPDFFSSAVEASLQKGKNKIQFEFDPYIFKKGNYQGRIKITAENGTITEFSLPLKIAPPMRKDKFRISTWGRAVSTKDWIDFCKMLGINTVDSTTKDMAILAENGFLYNYHYRIGNGETWGKESFRKIELETKKAIKKCQLFPNWVSTLINSETGPGRFPEKKAKRILYEKWAKKQLGFNIPEKDWQLGTPHNPPKIWFADNEKPGENGVFTPNKPLKFITWYYNHGGPWYQINETTARVVKNMRNDVITWTDPLHYPGQISKLDAGSTWAYDRGQGTIRIVEVFKKSYPLARLQNKPFFPTLGMDYVGPEWLKVTMDDGQKRLLTPTVDDLTRHAWVAVAGVPAEQLNYWAMDSMFEGIRKGKYYCAPDSAEKFGNILKTVIQPMGEMLKGAKLYQEQIGLLLPQSTSIVNAGEGEWHWGVIHFTSSWQKWLIKNDLPYDVIVDKNATPENLAKYQVIIFPMALYVSKKIYQGLMDAAQNGTIIITDRYGRQQYPNQEKWNIGYYNMIPKEERDDNIENAMKYVATLKESMAKNFYAVAKGSEGQVFTFVREFNGTRYVTVINDNRQPGEYTKLTGHPEFQPYGKSQRTKVYLNIPQSFVIYDFMESKLLAGKRENGKTVLDLQLPAAGGKLLAIYPGKIAKLELFLITDIQQPSKKQIKVILRNSSGNLVKGLQLLEMSIIEPNGSFHDESGIYQLKNGKATIPLRIAKNDARGTWRIEAKEKTSGIGAIKYFQVKQI